MDEDESIKVGYELLKILGGLLLIFAIIFAVVMLVGCQVHLHHHSHKHYGNKQDQTEVVLEVTENDTVSEGLEYSLGDDSPGSDRDSVVVEHH